MPSSRMRSIVLNRNWIDAEEDRQARTPDRPATGYPGYHFLLCEARLGRIDVVSLCVESLAAGSGVPFWLVSVQSWTCVSLYASTWVRSLCAIFPAMSGMY